MTHIFADAFYYFALFNRMDPAHAKAILHATTFRSELITTDRVLTEFADGLARSPGGRRQFVQVWGDLTTTGSGTRVIRSDPLLFEVGIDYYARRPDKAWSLTDCISFVAMNGLHITDALTADHHFEQAGFVALLK